MLSFRQHYTMHQKMLQSFSYTFASKKAAGRLFAVSQTANFSFPECRFLPFDSWPGQVGIRSRIRCLPFTKNGMTLYKAI